MSGMPPATVAGAGDRLTVLSLFAGIGGIDLGLERAGMRVVGQVERDRFCRSVLSRHWPEVPRHDDVRTCVDWWRSDPRPDVDVVAGGFPCQPVSLAGRRLGERDPRWLWPAMATVVAELRPGWVVWENVPGLRTRGLGTVLADLDRLGYRCRVGTISACALGAPHMRRRLFGLAHTTSQRRRQRRPGRPAVHGPPRTPLTPHYPHPTTPTQPTSGHARDDRWSAEPDLGRVAHGIPHRVDRLRALGNVVVPAVAHHIGQLITATLPNHTQSEQVSTHA